MKLPNIRRVSIGSEPIDRLLNGGLETDSVTTLYGPAGSGKSNLCLAATIAMARTGKQVIYLDTEGSFSAERFLQLAPDGEKIAPLILRISPLDWDAQKKNFIRLEPIIKESHGLIVIDSLTSLYRLALGKCGNYEASREVNCDLAQQLGVLAKISRLHKIPVLVSSQVYSNFNERKAVKMVTGDLLEYSSKCLIELQKTPDGFRRAILRKHRSIRDNSQVIFEIASHGLIDVNRNQPKSPLVEQITDIDEDPQN